MDSVGHHDLPQEYGPPPRALCYVRTLTQGHSFHDRAAPGDGFFS